jgi:flagellar basal body rod protein FlgB
MNVVNLNTPGYVPCDLDVEGFAALMARAVAEHMENDRLVLCDNENIRFGQGGFFETTPVVDEQAKQLLADDSKMYLEKQIGKLAENMVNHKVVTQLMLRQKRCASQPVGNGDGGSSKIVPPGR